MDKLVAIILHGCKVANKELLKDLLVRAEVNRVPLLYLKTVSKFHSDHFISSQLKTWEQKKRDYDTGFQIILHRLTDCDIQFLLVKDALYPRCMHAI